MGGGWGGECIGENGCGWGLGRGVYRGERVWVGVGEGSVWGRTGVGGGWGGERMGENGCGWGLGRGVYRGERVWVGVGEGSV